MEQKLQIRYTHYPDRPARDLYPGPSQQAVLYGVEEQKGILIAHIAVGETYHANLLDLVVGGHTKDQDKIMLPEQYGSVRIVANSSWPHHIGDCEPAYIMAGVTPDDELIESAEQLAVRIGYGTLAAAKLSYENVALSRKKYTRRLAKRALTPIYEAERRRLVYVHR